MTKKKPNVIKLINTANLGDWDGFVREIQDSPDRSTAILGGVFVDEQLHGLIVQFLIDDKSVIDELIGVEKPLSTFSSRTKIAYALGLISKLIYDDINIIRNIRNAFAHTVHGLDFEHENIKALCDKLQTPRKVLPPGALFAGPRFTFIATILFIASYIQMKIPDMVKQRRIAPSDYFGINWESHGEFEGKEWTNPHIQVVLPPSIISPTEDNPPSPNTHSEKD